MKISVLLDREPFDKIFEETFTAFLSDFFSYPHTVSWKKKKIIPGYKQITQQWLCNPLVNSIFVNGANQNIFNSINGEYAYNPLKPWRSKFQKFYLFLSQNKITAPILSKYIIDISPPIKGSENKLIIGGNTKIRLIDVVEGRVYVILKKGFDRKYIDREVYARENFKYLDIPKIYNTGTNAIWYSEEYISGFSPNRLDSNAGIKALDKVVIGIHKMLKDTRVSKSLSEYLFELEERVFDGLRYINYAEVGYKENIIEFIKKLSNELKEYSDSTLYTAYCHGDFHQGNILSDGDKNWILDWENSGQKQIGYDLIILLLESRISNGFSSRFAKLLNDEFDTYQWSLINNWPGVNWKKKEVKRTMMLLFLLEEIDFHVAENSNTVLYKNPKIFTELFTEWTRCFNSIIN
jgi:hypothetical protein